MGLTSGLEKCYRVFAISNYFLGGWCRYPVSRITRQAVGSVPNISEEQKVRLVCVHTPGLLHIRVLVKVFV